MTHSGGNTMSETERRVLAESEKFRAALPKLLRTLAGRWVVFRDGKVQKDFSSENDAYAFAVEKYGLDGAAVVAPVIEEDPRPITAAVVYGIA